MTSVLQRARQVITRAIVPSPFTDELDDVIVALTLAREASLDFAEDCAPGHGADAPVVNIVMPGESLDALLLNLEIARVRRNLFWWYRARLWWIWIVVLALNLFNLAGWVW